MSVIVKSGGGKSSGLYVWKKYEVIPPYLSFIGNEDFTLKTYNATKNWDGTLEYSTDATIWNTWDGTEISSVGNKLHLRGTGNTKITGNSSNYKFVFIGTDTLKIDCKGNIENLLDYETVSADNHPTMSDYCYYYLFKDCTALTTPPILPATVLSNYCYAGMFNCCTSLMKAPDLPAISLASSCYYYMFFNCTSLISPPALPATTLANSCYYYMFEGCTSLTTLPELPATILANSCYYYMFSGCTNIKLSTTQTGEYQTSYRIPKSGTGTTANYALDGMFSNTSGTFTGAPNINTTYYTSNRVV